jgi:signal transduction histidine kinase
LTTATLYRLHITHGNRYNFEHVVSAEPMILGRSARADIMLSEDSVSRNHARLFVTDGELIIEDLGSSNGVVVNGNRVTRSAISASDIVQIGCYILRAQPMTPSAQQKLVRRTEIEHGEVGPIHERLVKEADQAAVSFFYRVSQCLCTHRQMKPLLEGVLDAVMANVPAARGFILMRRDTRESLKLTVSRTREPNKSAPPISHTLVDHVLETRASVLTMDASQDDRFENSESIAAYQIKGVICVPLTGHDGVYGILYLDSESDPAPLTQDHLQLLSIVGQIVGPGVENIILTEKQIRQERLAGIGETVSGTSHDMRNIMVGISGGVQIMELACDAGNWDDVRSGLAIVRRSLNRFENLVDSMLAYVRQSDLNLAEANLATLVYEVINAFGPEAKRRRIDLQYDNRAPGNVTIDAQQVYRVLLNLVKNAMDAMEDTGGTIRIESGVDGGGVFVRVQDTGRGITPENLQRIGQPFFTTKAEKGTGLGLAICYRIMEQHRGRIQVDSVPNQGTTFTLQFPPDYSITRNDNPAS